MRTFIAFILIVPSTLLIAGESAVYIPDPNFKSIVTSIYDSNHDGEINPSEAYQITDLDISFANISDLTGIERFVHLIELNCSYNQISDLSDLSELVYLQKLYCAGNNLTFLPSLSSLNILTHLICSENRLTAIPELPPNLRSLDFSYNNVSIIPNLPPSLTNIAFSYNRVIQMPDLSALTELVFLNCTGNRLTSLPDLSHTKLFQLICPENELTSISGLPNTLEWLLCRDNQLTQLPDLAGLTLLTNLIADNNRLTSLPDMSDLTALIQLYCSSNELTSLPDLSHLTNLTQLTISHNRLTDPPDIRAMHRLRQYWVHMNDFDADDCAAFVPAKVYVHDFIYNNQRTGQIHCDCLTESPENVGIAAEPQGLDLLTIEAHFNGDPPAHWAWTNTTEEMVLGVNINPLVLPEVLTQATVIRLDYSDAACARSISRQILIPSPDYIDYNKDGCNTIEDLWALAPQWLRNHPNDPNGDGVMDIRDLLYVNTQGDCL